MSLDGPSSAAPPDNSIPKPRARKRRRTAGGAGEDCWTCKSRAVACDRKRPYCTQCIEIGRGCSGYKTTLSWNVGVASRGKLRGLACPVANKNVDGSDISPTTEKSGNETTTTTTAHKRTSSGTKIKCERETSQTAPLVTPQVGTQTYVPTPVPSVAPPPPYKVPLQVIPPQPYQDHTLPSEPINGQPLSASHPAFSSVNQLPSPTSRVEELTPTRLDSSYPHNDFYSPPHVSQISTSGLPSYAQPNRTIPSITPLVTTSQQTHSSITPPLYSSGDPYLGTASALPLSYSPLSYSPRSASSGYFAENETDGSEKHLMLFDSRFSSPFFSLTPRLQSLMEYYDRHICPYLVAFDGSENPYRKHILQLALHSEGLQNAVAALSVNNLRMRKKEPRQIGFVQEIPEVLTSGASINEMTAEELCYKQMSIDQLNMQFKDRRARKDDSVLATLLILCLFHVCDSGFSKFKTQLAGVQQILALRSPHDQSEFTRWVQMFFTWFDVMTSTVNDREMEIKGDAMAMLDFSSDLGAMEQFSGCDGRLFKLIARLGRLNLLAQGRDVKRTGGTESELPTQLPPPIRPALYRNRSSKFANSRSLSAADYENVDGNGWGTPIISSDEDGESADEPNEFDGRDEFWSEWHDIRNRLHTFEIALPLDPSGTYRNFPSDPAELQAGQRDMMHINESFRCSALLYTERLGHPSRPSSHPAFQALVHQALLHITALPFDSCVNKFLLWPLFIIGTECVADAHRALIRTRCVEVQRESGFYNNLSTLDVLERVWAESDAAFGAFRADAAERRARRRESQPLLSGGGAGGKRFGQAFRWRRAMDRVDGEYIVI